ncbi:ROK family transcriptional regulator [Pseudonocardia sp. TRM90224]|uniref:ROK family transcriptional regulator n=1 Tax=Pseudonocardia sp. TRM90224 TaxID=2812678 RepID=UPI001E5AFF2D|nr:ROK family transcriptional regulator [Pseudonocardia sp. TRM90224]
MQVSERIVDLVATGVATSRSQLAKELGLAPSTVSTKVAELMTAGLLAETGDGPSRGGRKPRVLTTAGTGIVVGVDVGARHLRLLALDLAGTVLQTGEFPFDIAAGPEVGLDALALHVERFALDQGKRLLAVGVGLPGPVQFPAGTVRVPARMPGWKDFPLRERLAQRLGLPVAVDNDTSLIALGEVAVRANRTATMVVVKAGTGIGCGLVTSGAVHRGAGGVAGDITHVRVDAGADIPCGCGNTGCLETVASGAAIVKVLQGNGIEVADTGELARLCDDAQPEVIAAVRTAGRLLGEVLAAVVNFVNPDVVVLAGRLASLEAFVAAVRGALYERCLPLVTQHLEVGVVTSGKDAGARGAAALAAQVALTGLPA